MDYGDYDYGDYEKFIRNIFLCFYDFMIMK